MKIIKKLLGFTIDKKGEPFKPGTRTVNVVKQPSFNEWCLQFNVSSAYINRHFG